MKRLLTRFLLLALVLVPSLLSAQTIARTLSWQQPGDTLANIQAYTYTAQVDTATATILTPNCVSGIPATNPVTCSAPIVFVAGAHTITLTAINGFGSATASLSGAPPSGPVSMTVVVKVTIP